MQFCHVDALAEVVAAAVAESLPPGVYNVAESASYTFAEYLAVLGDVAGVRPQLVPVEDGNVPAREYFPFRDADLVLDTARIEASGVMPEVVLRNGLAGTLAWFRAHGGHALAYEPTAYERRVAGER